MRILNIHGFDGDRDNVNYRVLKSLGHEVVSFQFNYRSDWLRSIYTRLASIVSFQHFDLIVCTSFGSFLGKRLSTQFNLPIIHTNPCFKPSITLKQIAPEFFTTRHTCEIEMWEADQELYDFSKDVIIIGTDDQVIDHEAITCNIANKATFYRVQGGKHSLEEKEVEEYFKSLTL